MDAATPRPPLVVLVEDDPLLRRFVELSLEELEIELSAHPDVASAWPVLAEARWRLLITDLMLPGVSGFELLERLAATPSANAGRAIVFSAGLQGPARARLQALGAWRLLTKPISALLLADCVAEGLAMPGRESSEPAAGNGHPGAPAGPTAPGTSAAATAERYEDDGGPAARSRAIEASFGGDAGLFHRYRATCLIQLPSDLAAGDAALAAGDMPGLRRVAHNLKSVLQLLGHPVGSALARQLEEDAAAGGTDAGGLWSRLRSRVEGIV